MVLWPRGAPQPTILCVKFCLPKSKNLGSWKFKYRSKLILNFSSNCLEEYIKDPRNNTRILKLGFYVFSGYTAYLTFIWHSYDIKRRFPIWITTLKIISHLILSFSVLGMFFSRWFFFSRRNTGLQTNGLLYLQFFFCFQFFFFFRFYKIA